MNREDGKLSCIILCRVRSFLDSLLQAIQHRLLTAATAFLGSTTIGKIHPTISLVQLVDHAHQIRPSNCWSCQISHIRLPDLIGRAASHRPILLASCTQTSRTNQQASFAHHSQHSFPIHAKSSFLCNTRSAPIAVGWLLLRTPERFAHPTPIGSRPRGFFW